MVGDQWMSVAEYKSDPSSLELAMDRRRVISEQVQKWCRFDGSDANTQMLRNASSVLDKAEAELAAELQRVREQQKHLRTVMEQQQSKASSG